MKFIGILIVSILTLSLVVSAPITWGNVGADDHLLARITVTRQAKVSRKHDVIINYPANNRQRVETVSGIRLWDNGGRTNFGYAQLLRGGPGYRNATIELISQKSKGLSYTMEYYGH